LQVRNEAAGVSGTAYDDHRRKLTARRIQIDIGPKVRLWRKRACDVVVAGSGLLPLPRTECSVAAW
jgi:hypothetical protein